MNMCEFDLLERIFNNGLRAENLTLIEPADGIYPEQRHNISFLNKSVDRMLLLDFRDANQNGRHLIPFFNQHQNEDDPETVENLNTFCDYILIFQYQENVFVFLLELKRGRAKGAQEQLDAAETLMDFVLSSAERIKNSNGYDMFSRSNIQIRKVIIRPAESNKEVTKPKDININPDKCLECRCLKEFRPMIFC